MTTSVTTQKTVSSLGAQQVVEAALAKAAELSLPATVSVVDASGNLKVMVRQDGAALLGVELSRRKAYTSVVFGGANTSEAFDFVSTVPSLSAGIPGQEGLALIGGAVPILQDGAVVGAIGVSAGTVEQDEQIAHAGAAGLS
jgi:glc operon protein GlcG